MDLTNDVIIHTKKDGIEYLQFKILLEYDILNCFTTRINNFNLDGRLDKSITDYNYKRLCDSLKIERKSIIKPNQSHTDVVERIDKTGYLYEDVDGFVTDKPNVNLTLSYGDCTPLLFFDPVHKAIGNIHSGWKGTAKKIGKKAVIKMQQEYGSKPEDLIVCIGPAIRECHFEVQEDVRSIYEKEFSYMGRTKDIIKKEEGKEGKFLINTTLVNKLMLQEVGVKPHNIYDSKICTVCSRDVVHSFRADKEKSGRNVAIIGLRQ